MGRTWTNLIRVRLRELAKRKSTASRARSAPPVSVIKPGLMITDEWRRELASVIMVRVVITEI
jgi:hypothetical protein